MYQEEIANLTKAHLRTHINGYLDIVQAIYGDGVKLQMPKSIETDNLVGGVYNAKPDEMPAYAIDVVGKVFNAVDPDNLWLYNYDGHIAGVVSGSSEEIVNKMIKRHEQAVEMFVKAHGNMHALENQLPGNDFRIKELGFNNAGFSGAEQINQENDRELWIAGFRIDWVWVVSENGPTQHA